MVLVLLAKFVVDGDQLLAVSAPKIEKKNKKKIRRKKDILKGIQKLPWSVKFDQNILILVESDGIKVLGNESFDGSLIPVFRNVFREQMGLDFAIDKVLNEVLHGVQGEFLGRRLVFGHLLFQMDQTHSGEFALLHAEEFEDTLVIILIGVDCDEQDL
jgi:hypothetical protein